MATMRRRPTTTPGCAARKSRPRPSKLGLPLPKLRLEPGRSLSGPSGVSVGTVGAVKQGEKKKWVNLDLSTNHLSWSAVLDWYYHPVPVVDALAERSETVDLVGPLCNSDELGPHVNMPPLERGDLVAFLDTGGYTEPCAARYNAQLLPATVLVCGDQATITTVREQQQDIIGRFRVPPRLLAGSFAWQPGQTEQENHGSRTAGPQGDCQCGQQGARQSLRDVARARRVSDVTIMARTSRGPRGNGRDNLAATGSESSRSPAISTSDEDRDTAARRLSGTRHRRQQSGREAGSGRRTRTFRTTNGCSG